MATVDQFERNPPATEVELEELRSAISFSLPPDYFDFLRESNGAEGVLGEAYVVIWSTHQIIERNEAYRVDEFAPHLILFGSDGAGEAYAFDTRSIPIAIVMVPFVGFDEEIHLGHTFGEFMLQVASSP